MNVQTARQLELHYREIRNLFDQRQIAPEDFQFRVDQLRFVDDFGITWQIATDGQWLRWDGAQWLPGDPYGDAYDNAALQYQSLRAMLARGQIDPHAFAAAVANLRVTEPSGEQWTIHPETGAWLVWNGQVWVEGEPPRRAADGSMAVEGSEFADFEEEYRRCYELLQANQISREEFDRRVDKLRLVDERGVWWQISKDTGGWLKWTGQQWVPGEPPRQKVSVDGPARKFVASVAESAKEELKATVRSLPLMIVRGLITRAVIAAVSYWGALYLHAYLLGYKNDGIRDDGGPWAPWLKLTESKQGDSYAYIWGLGGMLFSSLLFTVLSRHPVRNLIGAVKAPFAILSGIKSRGIFGFAAMAFGAGLALVIAARSGVNPQANLSLGIGLLFIGAGQPGYYVARFFAGVVRRVMAPKVHGIRQKIPIDLRVAQLAILGVAPGFYIASKIDPSRHLMYGIGLLAFGAFAVFGMKKPKAAPGTICTILLCGIFGTLIAIVWDWLFPHKAHADDGGRDEFMGDPKDYWKTEGGKLLDASKGAADAAGAGSVAGGGLNPPPIEPPEEEYTTSLCLDEYAMTITDSLNEDVRAWVVVSGKDPVKCAQLEAQYNASIQMAVTGNVTDWFSAESYADATGAVCNFHVQIPDDPAQRRGPNIAYVVATVQAGARTLSKKCRINLDVQADYEIRMDDAITVKANESYQTYYAYVDCKDPSMDGSEQLAKSRALAPSIKFVLSGDVAHWVGGPGPVEGYLVGEGKEIRVEAVVPPEDLKREPPYTVDVEVSCEAREFGVLSRGGRIEIEPPDWFVELQPLKDKMILDFKDAAAFRVRLIHLDSSKMELYGGENGNMLNEHLTVRVEGANQQYAILEEKESDGAWRYFNVRFSEAASGVQVEPFLDIVPEARLTGRQVSQRFRIDLSAKPSFEFLQKNAILCAGGEPLPVRGRVKDGKGFKWELQMEVVGLPEVEPAEEPKMEEGEKFTINLKASEVDKPTLQFRTGKLKVVAVAQREEGEPLETEPVELELKLGSVGLIVQPNPIKLPLDPTKEAPSQLSARVLYYDEASKQLRADLAAMQKLSFDEWQEGDTPDGHKAFIGAGVSFKFAQVQGSGIDAVAVYQVKQKVVVPTAQAIDALMLITAPGDRGPNAEAFQVLHKFIIPANPDAYAAERIRKEQENCRKTLRYLPEGELKAKFAKIIENDAKILGADGLYHLRRQIWDAAQDALMKEAQNYLEDAKFYDRVAEALDWANYLIGLIVQGMSSVLVPFPGDMAVNLLYQSIPDLVNAVSQGQSPKDWFKNWANGVVANAGGMAVDIAIGQAINLEQLFLRGMAQYKDPRKAGLIAATIYLNARFARYQVTTKPNGDPYSLKEAILASLRDLAEEIVTSGVSKATKRYHEGPGHGYDPKDGCSYHDTDIPPDLSGMPDANIKAAQDIAKKHNVEIYVRPTNPASKKLLEEGAHPKPESIKTKTINELDLKLGRKPEDLGKVGYFDPGPNPPPKGNMSDAEYSKLKERYEQRRQEFINYQHDIEKLKQKGITVNEDGVIIAKDGKPFTGDHDIFDIRGPGGKPLTDAERNKVLADLMKPPFSAQHPGHRQWDYSKADKYTPPPEKNPVTGKWELQKSKYNKCKSVDEKIRDSHQIWTSKGEPGEPLIKFGPDGSISGKHFDRHGKTLDRGGRVTQSASSSIRHDEAEKDNEEGGTR